MKLTTLSEQMAQNSVPPEKATTDQNLLRQAIISEYDAITLYEQMAQVAKNDQLKRVLLDVAKEEKVHVGEFEALLNKLDKEHKPSTEEGEKEINEL